MTHDELAEFAATLAAPAPAQRTGPRHPTGDRSRGEPSHPHGDNPG